MCKTVLLVSEQCSQICNPCPWIYNPCPQVYKPWAQICKWLLSSRTRNWFWSENHNKYNVTQWKLWNVQCKTQYSIKSILKSRYIGLTWQMHSPSIYSSPCSLKKVICKSMCTVSKFMGTDYKSESMVYKLRVHMASFPTQLTLCTKVIFCIEIPIHNFTGSKGHWWNPRDFS